MMAQIAEERHKNAILNDLLSDMELERTDYEPVPETIIDEFELMAEAEAAEDIPEPDDLEMGFDPYLGCYTDDC